jgi:hypothetical protein
VRVSSLGRLLAVLAFTAGIAAALALAAGGNAGSAHAPILAALNAQRAANGIPAHVRENTTWSARCAAHDSYMAATGAFGHTELAGNRASTTGGSWAAARSVLAEGSSWQQGDPFDDSPLHLIQLMSPELRQVGLDARSGYLCMTTWPGYVGSGWKQATVYTYPGAGVTGVPYAETAEELPFVPETFIGLPTGAPTGFNIMVYAEGLADEWHARITSAKLTGPDGPVAVRTIDRTTAKVGPYLPPGSGFMIPVAPLRPGATYTATVSFDGGKAAKTWRFTTARRVPLSR